MVKLSIKQMIEKNLSDKLEHSYVVVHFIDEMKLSIVEGKTGHCFNKILIEPFKDKPFTVQNFKNSCWGNDTVPDIEYHYDNFSEVINLLRNMV
jgi:hypothetical protein